MANVLTAVRLLLAVPLAYLLRSASPSAAVVAAIAMVVAIATDLADGPLARRTGTATAFGGLFDHTTDCLFVVAGMLGGRALGIPVVLPVLVAAAFLQYAVDSYWLHRQLRGSRLGRYNGILYFFPPCGVILIRLGLAFLQPVLVVLCWLLVVSTLMSMTERVRLSWRARRTGPPSPA